jgi:putative tryptophan/tyrosine transport system permease protein
MDFYLSALILGLGFAAMGLGIYISLRIFNIPDITTDGSFTLGAAITASFLVKNVPIPVILIIVMAGGALAGMATGLIHTRLKVNPLLAGILVMTSLYSVNLAVMGRSNIPLINTANVQNLFGFIPVDLWQWLSVMLLFAIILWLLLSWLLRTDFGLAMQATGSSETMIRAMGVNTRNMKVIGLAFANALTAISGFLICQYQQFTDINMGISIVIFGLGSVMMGEAFFSMLKVQSVPLRLIGVLIGCIVFRMIIAFALSIGIDPNWLKFVTAAIVLIVVGIPNLRKGSPI